MQRCRFQNLSVIAFSAAEKEAFPLPHGEDFAVVFRRKGTRGYQHEQMILILPMGDLEFCASHPNVGQKLQLHGETSCDRKLYF